MSQGMAASIDSGATHAKAGGANTPTLAGDWARPRVAVEIAGRISKAIQ